MTGELPRAADVAVVGGGVMGGSIAYHLARRGADVVLLERNAICSGPTRHSTAIIRLHYSQGLLVRMAAYGHTAYVRFAEEVGSPSGFTRTGMLFAAAAEERDLLLGNVELGRAEGALTFALDEDDVRSIEPRLATEGLAFCYEPDAGHCDPLLVTSGYATAAARAGARVVEGVRAERLEDGAVHARGGRIDAAAVVVAAGPWSAPLLAPVGYELPLKAGPAEIGRYRLPAAFGTPPPAIADFSGTQFYLRPSEPGHLEVGSLAPEHADEPVDPDRPVEGARAETLERYAAALAQRLPAAAGGHWRGAWTGVYDVTPDWEPAIGRVPGCERVYVAAGFSGHGFKLAPAVGLTVAELVLDGTAQAFDLALLAPERFAEGRLVGARYGYSVLA